MKSRAAGKAGKIEASGVGVGYRPALGASLLRSPGRADFVEVVAEALADPRALREARALSEIWPVVPHGVKLSLGSAEGIDEERAARLGALARELRAPLVTEHVAFVRAGGHEIGHLTELPFTREAVRVVARNVARARRHLPDVPLALENAARAFVWPSDGAGVMPEGDFYRAIVDATGCELLLDVANVYANARNMGVRPSELLATYPLDRVAMIHVAGGWTDADAGFTFDTHTHPVAEDVFTLLAEAIAAAPQAPVMLERDGAIVDPDAVLAEVDRLRAIARPPQREGSSIRRASAPLAFAGRDDLVDAQRRLAQQLTGARALDDGPEILRARSVLARKRAEDALAHLPSLRAELTVAQAAAIGRFADTARPAKRAGVCDAIAIAEAACADARLTRAALRDRLLLHAEVGDDLAPRRGPFVGRALVEGRSLWALKGFGRGARVRLIERDSDTQATEETTP